MSGFSKSQSLQKLEERLEKYRDIECKILESGAESYSIGDRSKTNLKLETVEKIIRRLENQCDRLRNGGGVSVRLGVPRD